MVNKGAVAVGVFLATNGVVWFGFDPTSDSNTESAKLALAFLYSVIPAALACVALPLLWKYPLTKERQARMRAHIEKRDARRDRVAAASGSSAEVS
jgi:Na+/melibiose symporter-like transporter